MEVELNNTLLLIGYEILYHSEWDFKHNWIVPNESWETATPGNFYPNQIKRTGNLADQ